MLVLHTQLYFTKLAAKQIQCQQLNKNKQKLNKKKLRQQTQSIFNQLKQQFYSRYNN